MYATKEFMNLRFFVNEKQEIVRRNSICSYHEPVDYEEENQEINARLEHKDVDKNLTLSKTRTL